MGDGTGFDLLEQIKYINFRVVFITSFDHFAIRAFKFSAMDYLLKPVKPDDLVEAVSKIQVSQGSEDLDHKLEVLLSKKNKFDKIALPTVDGLLFVKVDDIVRCESYKNYTTFFLNDGEQIVVTRIIKEYDEMLTPNNFFRIHKSHLINLAYIKKYVKGEGGFVVMDDNTEVEVARRRKEEFLRVLSNE